MDAQGGHGEGLGGRLGVGTEGVSGRRKRRVGQTGDEVEVKGGGSGGGGGGGGGREAIACLGGFEQVM